MGNDNQDIKERLKVILKDKGTTINGIYKSLNIPQKTLNNQINGTTTVGMDTVLAIISLFPEVSLKWLLKGEGEKYNITEIEEKQKPLKEKKGNVITNKIVSTTVSQNYSNYRLVPQYSLDVVGGSYNKEVDSMGYVTGYIPFVNAKEQDICCPVTGYSMHPTYPSGSIVLIRRIEFWKKFIEFGQVYIIELLDDRRLIKELRKGKDEEHFLLISHNHNFDEIQVPVDMIRSVWLVLAKYEKAVM